MLYCDRVTTCKCIARDAARDHAQTLAGCIIAIPSGNVGIRSVITCIVISALISSRATVLARFERRLSAPHPLFFARRSCRAILACTPKCDFGAFAKVAGEIDALPTELEYAATLLPHMRRSTTVMFSWPLGWPCIP